MMLLLRGMSEARQVRQRREIWDPNCTVLQLEYLVSLTNLFHLNICSSVLWGGSRNFGSGTELKEIGHWWWVLGHRLFWDIHPLPIPFLPPNLSHFELSYSSKLFHQTFIVDS